VTQTTTKIKAADVNAAAKDVDDTMASITNTDLNSDLSDASLGLQ